MSDTLGIYVHIPYCRSKCPYCDFFSMRGNTTDYENYISLLKNSIEYWSYKSRKDVDTIYIGGGTPSVLRADQIAEIINNIKKHFNVLQNAEITMEANPKSALDFDFSLAASAGLNRVSLGVQSANENELKKLGRLHNQKDVTEAVKMIKESGINNISIDLMLGIPDQTADSLKKSIDFCAELDVKHISTYILKIEENTVFAKKRDNYNFPNDDTTSDLYLFSINHLKEKGFYQYEISNFCRDGFESRHNLKYWNLDDYLGIGPAAHSFVDGRRFYYERSVESFADNKIIDDGSGGSESEYIMLRLRLVDGLDLNEYKKAFGKYPDKDFFDTVEKYCKFGYMTYENDNVRFTEKGFLVSNSILSELI